MRCSHVYAKEIRAEDGGALLWRKVGDSASKSAQNGSAGRSWTHLFPWILQICNYMWGSSNGVLFPWKGIWKLNEQSLHNQAQEDSIEMGRRGRGGPLDKGKTKHQVKKFMDHRWRGSTSWSLSIFWRCVKQLGYYLWTKTSVGAILQSQAILLRAMLVVTILKFFL